MGSIFDEDDYNNKLLARYLHTEVYVSDCCSEEMDDEDNGICPHCKEHCNMLSEADVKYNVMCEIADAKYQEMKDER